MRLGILGGRNLPTAHTGAVAYAVGREVARRGHLLVTGGARGSGEEACRGAHEWLLTHGTDPGQRIVSYVPEGKKPEHAYGRYEHRGFTWKDRRGLLVWEADFFFVVGGSDGTLDEVKAGHRGRVPMLPAPGTGGAADALYHRMHELAQGRAKRLLDQGLLPCDRPENLARRLVALAMGWDSERCVLQGLLQRFWETAWSRLRLEER